MTRNLDENPLRKGAHHTHHLDVRTVKLLQQLQHGTFNWDERSWAVAQYCPEHFDSERYNWKEHSWAVAKYCPQYFDAERYNWVKDSDYVAIHCPQHFDADRYNWEEHSWAVAKYCPEKFDAELYNWENSYAVVMIRKYATHLLFKDLTIP